MWMIIKVYEIKIFVVFIIWYWVCWMEILNNYILDIKSWCLVWIIMLWFFNRYFKDSCYMDLNLYLFV